MKMGKRLWSARWECLVGSGWECCTASWSRNSDHWESQELKRVLISHSDSCWVIEKQPSPADCNPQHAPFLPLDRISNISLSVWCKWKYKSTLYSKKIKYYELWYYVCDFCSRCLLFYSTERILFSLKFKFCYFIDGIFVKIKFRPSSGF